MGSRSMRSATCWSHGRPRTRSSAVPMTARRFRGLSPTPISPSKPAVRRCARCRRPAPPRRRLPRPPPCPTPQAAWRQPFWWRQAQPCWGCFSPPGDDPPSLQPRGPAQDLIPGFSTRPAGAGAVEAVTILAVARGGPGRRRPLARVLQLPRRLAAHPHLEVYLAEIPAEKAKTRSQLAEEAIAAALASQWERVVELNTAIRERFGSEEETNNRLGKAYLELGRFDDALSSYKATLELNPLNAIALKNVNRIEALIVEKGAVKRTTSAVDVNLFVEEMGKTALAAVQLAPGVDSALVTPGELGLEAEEELEGMHAVDPANEDAADFGDEDKHQEEY